MKSSLLAAVALAQSVAGHAIFQQLWVDGKDMISAGHCKKKKKNEKEKAKLTPFYGTTCNRLPTSNTPVTSVSSAAVACNVNGRTGVASKCPAVAGGSVTIEMHQQPNDRNCKNEAIGGAHYGPVTAYLSKVADSATADGTSGQWFKIFEDGWAPAKSGSGGVGDGDAWGTKDLNSCCGRMDVKLPAELPNGDYLLRAEAIALHTAGSAGGAQLYMSCYQLTVTGGTATALPADAQMVKFPGAYSARDPGLLINIHAAVKSYTVPGPAVLKSGTVKVAGSGCDGCAKTCSLSAAAGKASKAVFEPTSPADEIDVGAKRAVAFTS
ncbi:Glycoside hydrolase, family 61 [Niveomyces insectorum RCEF 264]|uniref:lytic cellulose monooxygenase (C4-dehydrogenating) n=1 Tax=Niveomyces insectorum RCEF 264 TaxID=1081102 RepID=A0A167SQ11_9HYPO|nr:Glycoside hydrolase, family 61 [Niveomyces insectorum RCEF 264]